MTDYPRAIRITKDEAIPAFENFRARVYQAAERSVEDEESLTRFLRSWWCQRYSKPFKDPMLLDYSVEELLWEYLETNYRADPVAAKEAKEAVKRTEEDEDWLKKQMGDSYQDLEAQEKTLAVEADAIKAAKQSMDSEVVEQHVTFGG